MSMNRREKFLSVVTVFTIAFGLVGMQARNRIDLIKRPHSLPEGTHSREAGLGGAIRRS